MSLLDLSYFKQHSCSSVCVCLISMKLQQWIRLKAAVDSQAALICHASPEVSSEWI